MHDSIVHPSESSSHNADDQSQNQASSPRPHEGETTENRPNVPPAIRTARADDLPFILDLSKKHSNAIGFIPAEGVANYVTMRLVKLAFENDEPAGFILAKHRVPDTPGIAQIHQAAICYDLQRRHIGFSLVKQTIAAAAVERAALIQLWCRSDLEANEFWRIAGFEAIALREGGTRRDHPHVLWRYKIMRGANIIAPSSNRRRGRAGAPVYCPEGIGTGPIIEACRSGTISKLLSRWSAASKMPSIESGETLREESDGAGAIVEDASLWTIRARSQDQRVSPANRAA
jgi:N-acetylglutamate synthase-like GNAT family acetyltransferase